MISIRVNPIPPSLTDPSDGNSAEYVRSGDQALWVSQIQLFTYRGSRDTSIAMNLSDSFVRLSFTSPIVSGLEEVHTTVFFSYFSTRGPTPAVFKKKPLTTPWNPEGKYRVPSLFQITTDGSGGFRSELLRMETVNSAQWLEASECCVADELFVPNGQWRR